MVSFPNSCIAAESSCGLPSESSPAEVSSNRLSFLQPGWNKNLPLSCPSSRKSLADMVVWPPAPTPISLPLSTCSQSFASEIIPTASLISAHAYLAHKPVVRTARRETFCFAHHLDQQEVWPRQASDRMLEDLVGLQKPLVEDSFKERQAGTFLDFMVMSGTISRRKRSRERNIRGG